tara:strand:+ start:5493 stop:6407 length:915 start_codon:yes stop_codon:yes gene_type:complete
VYENLLIGTKDTTYDMKYEKLITNKKILITGGAGFVGSHLAKKLYDYGNTIYVLDNYFTGRRSNQHKGINYKKSDTINIFSIYKNISLDYIYHLGEYSKVEQSYDDIELVLKFNTSPFYEVLKLAKKHQSKLIYAGSSTKFSQKSDVVESPYSFSKKINTNILNKYAEWLNLKYAITYFYNVYGPKEISDGKYATVIGKFLRLKKENSKFLPVTKPGNQKRRFTHIDDIVNGLILVGKKGSGDDYGIGADQSYSIIQIANILKMPYKLTPLKKGNRIDGLLKTSKTKKLGWRQKNYLKDYLLKN